MTLLTFGEREYMNRNIMSGKDVTIMRFSDGQTAAVVNKMSMLDFDSSAKVITVVKSKIRAANDAAEKP